MHKITFIKGDGTGPDVSYSARKCIDATGVKITWDEKIAGEEAIEKFGTPLPEETLNSIRENKVCIKGPITTPVGKGFRSVNVALRQQLDLYACVRPCKTYKGVKSKYENIDIVIIRENTEDLYAGVEFQKGTYEAEEVIKIIEKLSGKKIGNDSGITIKPISVSATERIVKFAFEYAIKNNRKKVTVVHKANIMKYTDGLFLEVAQEVAKKYDGKIEFEDKLVDNMCMQLVQKPEIYDVLVLPNLYGDIISDLCAGLVGGLGMAPGANIGDNIAIFEPTHGSSPKYKGLDKVNPVATILSGVMMLRYIGEGNAADKLEFAVAKTIKEGKRVTYDLASDMPAKCSEMTEEIIKNLKEISYEK